MTPVQLRSAPDLPAGAAVVRLSATGAPDSAERVGHDLAEAMLADGASSIMGEVAS